MQSTILTRHPQTLSPRTSRWATCARWVMLFAFLLGWVQSALVLPAQYGEAADGSGLRSSHAVRSLQQALGIDPTAHVLPPASAQLRHGLPIASVQPASEAELMDEDDDESKHVQQDIPQTVFALPAYDEDRYASFLRNRLGQLEASLRQRAEVARFIRFHSWKSDPC